MRPLQPSLPNGIMAHKKQGRAYYEIIVRRTAAIGSRFCCFVICDGAGAGRCPGPHRQVVPAHVGPRRWIGAPHVAGLDWTKRLRHTERRLSSADDGAALVFEKILQFTDAA